MRDGVVGEVTRHRRISACLWIPRLPAPHGSSAEPLSARAIALTRLRCQNFSPKRYTRYPVVWIIRFFVRVISVAPRRRETEGKGDLVGWPPPLSKRLRSSCQGPAAK